ncbi:MAG TPA: ATP-dependent DNA helicase RecG [Candidatus Acidoferrum sp.]|nr:ATP-dependent DNA helicase RecG [Candidatus Acidoferrum sp.]
MSSDITKLNGVGPARAALLQRLGIESCEDAVRFYPRAYEDRRAVVPIGETALGAACSVCGHVMTVPSHARIRKGMELTRFRIADGTGTADITYFNQPWMKNLVKKGEEYAFYGRVEGDLLRRAMANPAMARIGSPEAEAIVPIYKLTAGVSQKILRGLVWQAVELMADKLPEALPPDLMERYALMPLGQALKTVHRPGDPAGLATARRRLAFEELFTLSLGLSLLGRRVREAAGAPIPKTDMAPFFAALPFEPTGAQRRVIEEALSDMAGEVPMNRLVQGDVGSGKTAVAAALCYAAAKSGFQSAMMAPTEILAGQHYETLSGLLGPLGQRTVLVTGGMPAKERRAALEAIAAGEADLVVGTHALIEGGCEFTRLGLVITDEQHRFGVAQRAALSAKGDSPHTLVMSATPIPRTLALMIYGDLDVSALDEMPKGRQKIDTFVVEEEMRLRIDDFILKQLHEGRQVFVVCPVIENEEEEGEGSGLIDVVTHAARLSKVCAPHAVAALHGRMKPAEKERIMGGFAKGAIGVLVATTVVEVGVDVPNANLMVVENAERFGLSQLHQLRGRVGRGPHKSYCVLFRAGGGEVTKERLAVMEETNDGFEIARKDLELRGPGDFFGERQHGLPPLTVADLTTDADTVAKAATAAHELLAADPGLAAHPELLKNVKRLFAQENIIQN